MKATPPTDTITAQDERLALLARALAHPARVAIVRHLATSGTCICGQLVDLLPLAQATVSQHLKILKESGFVRGEVDGPRTCYCVDPDVIGKFQSLAAKLPA